LLTVIGDSIYPAIISAKKVSEKLYKQRVSRVIKYMSLFAIPFALFITFFSDKIIHSLYGDHFTEAAIYLSMYIWTGLPYVTFFVLNQVCLIEKINKTFSFVTILTVVSNILLNLFLIPKYGGVGAVMATLTVSYVGQLLIFVLILAKSCGE
ncbi:MAG: polysaccharide biosynthesis C-terminal domain-containing protein, partial [Bacteroidales bacterium]|nr:polysaccharide biosynthesis C-terminal domain-containing protein [Bacteroidales bacterium]